MEDRFKLDKQNRNTTRTDTIAKEMSIWVAIDVIMNGFQPPDGYQFVECHLIFEMKIGNFHYKVSLVTRGHRADVPAKVKYASDVFREIVCIALTIAVLNALKVMAADIINAYITVPNKEKIWALLGPEFGDVNGQKAIVIRAFYRLKSASVVIGSYLADCMRNLSYKSNKADPDLWKNVCTRETANGLKKYYSYTLAFVDFRCYTMYSW